MHVTTPAGHTVELLLFSGTVLWDRVKSQGRNLFWALSTNLAVALRVMRPIDQ